MALFTTSRPSAAWLQSPSPSDTGPRVIIGAYTTDFGPEVDHWIHSNYQQTSVPGAATPVFVLRDAKAP